MGAEALAELSSLLELDGTKAADGTPATVEAVEVTLCSTLPQIIAVNWEPEAGKNQLEARA